MSVGPLGGIAASAAGSSLAQSKGSDVDRAQQDTQAQQRRVHMDKKAESAAGIGEADGQDHEAADRDADGRRLWESMEGDEKTAEESGEESAEESGGEAAPIEPRQSKDATGDSGNLLDLSG